MFDVYTCHFCVQIHEVVLCNKSIRSIAALGGASEPADDVSGYWSPTITGGVRAMHSATSLNP